MSFVTISSNDLYLRVLQLIYHIFLAYHSNCGSLVEVLMILFAKSVHDLLQVTDMLSSRYDDTTKRQQLNDMKRELSKLSIVNEFAQYARLERRINALTQDIKSKCMLTYAECDYLRLFGRCHVQDVHCEQVVQLFPGQHAPCTTSYTSIHNVGQYSHKVVFYTTSLLMLTE